MLFTSEYTLDQAFEAVQNELHKGAQDNHHPFHLVIMASQSTERPELRYVVLRKVDDDLCLYIFTDGRSSKVQQLSAHDRMSLLFYHQELKTQIRVKGTALLHQQDELSENFWSTLDAGSQQAYQQVLPPGTPISDPNEAYLWDNKSGDMHFLVIRIVTHEILALQLDGLRHVRAKFTLKNGNWDKTWLAP